MLSAMHLPSVVIMTNPYKFYVVVSFNNGRLMADYDDSHLDSKVKVTGQWPSTRVVQVAKKFRDHEA